MNGPQPIDIGSVGVIQHAPVGPFSLKPATFYLPSGQSLICLPPQSNAAAITAGAGLLYSGIPLQRYTVIPSSSALGCRHQAFPMVQPPRYNSQLNQQWPSQPPNAIGNLPERPNGKVHGGLQITQTPSQGMYTITRPQSATTGERCSSKRHDYDALLSPLQRHLPQQPHEPQHQQQQQPVCTSSSSTKRTTNSSSKMQQQKPTASPSASNNSSITRAAPYYLRRRVSRADHGIDGPKAVRGEDEKRSRSGNCGRIRALFFNRPKRLCWNTTSRYRVPLDVDDRVVSSAAVSNCNRSAKTTSSASSKAVDGIDGDTDAMIGSSSVQRQQSETVGDMPPLAMLEALCLRFNDDNCVKSSTV